YGWVAADQFVTGLRRAGADFTRRKVIDALNEETEYDANGLIAPIDWTVQHEEPPSTTCQALIRIEDGELARSSANRASRSSATRHCPMKFPTKWSRGERRHQAITSVPFANR
ncbi:MAG: hypothetical protein ACRDWD_09545, partial [Acidimicrobiia bacterium]